MGSDAQALALAKILGPELREVVAREIRSCGLMSEPAPIDPPPTAIDCERTVLATVLAGKMGIAELGELQCRHLFLPFHRWLFSHLTKGVTDHLALRELALDEHVAPELIDLCARPVKSKTEVLWAISEIMRTARSRRIITAGEAILIRLRTGDMTNDEALAALRKMAPGPRGTK